MAIEITRFTAVDNMTQLTQWLNDNAVPDYFDSVTISGATAQTITCTMGDTAYFTIGHPSAMEINYHLKGKGMPNEVTYRGPDRQGVYFDFIVKTSNGIMLHASQGYEGIITKTDSGGVAFIYTNYAFFYSYNQSGMKYPRIQMVSVENSSEATQFPVTSEQDHGEMETAGMTVTPLYIGTTGDVCPNCFYLHSNQHLGEHGKFQIDGINYYSNGYIALKE